MSRDYQSHPEKGKEWVAIKGIESTETLYGLYRHFFAPSGTGPDGRGIAIYNLEIK